MCIARPKAYSNATVVVARTLTNTPSLSASWFVVDSLGGGEVEGNDDGERQRVD